MADPTPRDLIMQAVSAVQAIGDPREQALCAHELQKVIGQASMQVRQVMSTATATLRQTHSLQDLATLLDVSRARIQQMTKPFVQ